MSHKKTNNIIHSQSVAVNSPVCGQYTYGDTKPEHRPTAEPETNNDHMFYYEPSSATWSEVTVKASDPYGNVYTESIRNE